METVNVLRELDCLTIITENSKKIQLVDIGNELPVQTFELKVG